MQAVRVGVVMGGVSSEREISLRSGAAVTETLGQLGYDVVPIDLGSGASALADLAGASMDVAFLALHGRQGEDGVVQGILEMLGIPYTGSGVLGSALAMDKLKSKELFRLHNVPTPPYYELRRSQTEALAEIHGSFGYPAIVKPRREGSSLGVVKVDSLAELSAAVENALQYDDSVLVERFVSGREIAVGLLDGRVLGAIEIAPRGDVYDFEAKYTPGMSDYFIPARLEATRITGVLKLAERAVEALEVRGAARVDLLVTEGANEYVLEVNTLPGMTETSLFPRIAAAAGYDFGGLCEAMLQSARLDSSCVRPHVVPRHAAPGELSTWEADGSFEDAGYAVVAARGRRGARSVQRSA
ncbi:MAG: D-alanine--D-alanine ligase [Myxococcales bacterium]|jgi:D-alanine-D-alanine ligase|nr:D-alanine--D-alanine ligase [Myxococcales bacterium]